MSNFSYVKALEAEVADLKAELVELSAKVPADEEAQADDGRMLVGGETLVTVITAGALGLLAGYALGARGYLPRF